MLLEVSGLNVADEADSSHPVKPSANHQPICTASASALTRQGLLPLRAGFGFVFNMEHIFTPKAFCFKALRGRLPHGSEL